MINSRLISDLALTARNVCNAHILGCKEAGIEIIVTSTYRDFEAQTELYAIGRTKEKHRNTVTNARAGESWHNFRCAWDIVPIVGGKASWDDKLLWKEAIKIGKNCGAEAGADWSTFPDMPHFQVRPSPHFTLAQALDRFQEMGTIFL